MEHGMDGSLIGECQLVYYWKYHLSYWKGAMMPRG